VSASERRFVAVIAALDLELRPLRNITLCSPAPPVRLFQSGAGPIASRRSAENAVAAGAGGLVSWGLAGGLVSAAKTGNVILCTRVTRSVGPALLADSSWSDQIATCLPAGLVVQRGGLLSSETVLPTPEAKTAAARESGALAVDMETHAIAAVAAASHLPWLGVRVVADSVLDRLPPALERCVDASGNTRLAGVLGIMGRPGQWAGLIRIAIRYRRANRSLALVAEGLAASGLGLPGTPREIGVGASR